MKKELEIEAKYLLNKAGFDTLINHFKLKESDFFLQKNHYFDTDDRLLLTQLNMMLRVREKNNCFELTLKLPHHDHLLEMNYLLTHFNGDKQSFTQFSEIKQILEKNNISLSTVKFQATLCTKRAKISYLGGELFFDISTYNATKDYEVEYEVNTSMEDAQAKLTSLLQFLKIGDYRPSCPKAKRCLQKKC